MHKASPDDGGGQSSQPEQDFDHLVLCSPRSGKAIMTQSRPSDPYWISLTFPAFPAAPTLPV
jgi:hypothetical protein